MNKHKRHRKRIALLYGGRGLEHSVSLRGYEYMRSLIDPEEFILYSVLITEDGEWLATDGREPKPTYPVRIGRKRGFLTDGKILPCAAAIPLLHGDMGEDGIVQGALECAGIPYIGAGVRCGALTCDKIYTKIIAEAIGIPTVPWISVTEPLSAEEAMRLAEEKIGYPMFIKPSGLGSSIGSHPVESRADFAPAYNDAMRLGTGRILIEELIPDMRELECAYHRSRNADGVFEAIVTPPGEICLKGFYDYREKYDQTSRAIPVPRADLDADTVSEIREYAAKLAAATGLRQLARIDFFLKDGRLYFNEINTFPGFTNISLYPLMMEAAGLSGRELVGRMIRDVAEGAI